MVSASPSLISAVEKLDQDLLNLLKVYASGTLFNPYPLYAKLREISAPYWSEDLGMWLITDFDNVEAALDDPRLANSRILGYEQALTPENRIKFKTLNDHLSHWLGFEDPPVHPKSRGYIKEYVSGRLAIRMKPTITAIVTDLIAKFKEKGFVDVVTDFAYPLPAAIIYELLGIDRTKEEEFKKLADSIGEYAGNVGPILNDVAPGSHASLLQMEMLINDIAKDRLANPKDDLISRLVLLEDSGEITHQEMVSLITFVFMAGFGTTMNLIANGMMLVLTSDSQRSRLSLDPSLIGTAVEEFLRFEAPIQIITRLSNAEVEIQGNTIAPGDYVALIAGAANRDPKYFAHPEELDIGRDPNRHISFGRSAHFCLGAPLARVEAQVAIGMFFEAFPKARLVDPEIEWNPLISFRHLKSLRVDLGTGK